MRPYRLTLSLLGAPSRALQNAEASLQAAGERLNNALRGLARQDGFGTAQIRTGIAETSNRVKALSERAGVLYQGLVLACSLTEQADNAARLRLRGVPEFIVSGEKLISYDFSGEYLRDANKTVSAIAIAFGNGILDGVNGYIPAFDSLPEKYQKASLANLVDTLANNQAFIDEAKKQYDKIIGEYEPFDNLIRDVIESGGVLSDAYNTASEFDSDDLRLALLFRDPENIKFLEEAAKPLAILGEAKEYSEKGYEILRNLFKDYTEQLFYLEKIREALLEAGYDSQLVNDCIAELTEQYRDSVLAAWEEVVRFGAEKGVEYIEGKLLGIVTGGLFSAVKYGQAIANQITGLDETADRLGELYASQGYSNALVEQYEHYAELLRSGAYSEENVAHCEMYLKMAIAAKIREYTLLREMYNDAIHGWKGLLVKEASREDVEKCMAQIDHELERMQKISEQVSENRQTMDALDRTLQAEGFGGSFGEGGGSGGGSGGGGGR